MKWRTRMGLLALALLAIAVGYWSTAPRAVAPPRIVAVPDGAGGISLQPNATMIERLRQREARRGAWQAPPCPSPELDVHRFFHLDDERRRSLVAPLGDLRWWKHLWGNAVLERDPQIAYGLLKTKTASYVADLQHGELPVLYRSVLAQYLLNAQRNPAVVGLSAPPLSQDELRIVYATQYDILKDRDPSRAMLALASLLADMGPLPATELSAAARACGCEPYPEDIDYLLHPSPAP